MNTTMRVLCLVLVLLGIAGGVAGCANTVRGVGEDVRDTSHAISDETR